MSGFRSVLVDAGVDADGALSPLAGGAHNVLIVMRPERASITAAYACIKRLHHLYAWRQFHLIVNMAASEAAVQAILRNLARTASQYLGVEALCAGWLPSDPLVARGVQLGRCVVEAFRRRRPPPRCAVPPAASAPGRCARTRPPPRPHPPMA